MLPAEMMEAVVNAIKTAYNPVPVNVVTWDAALHPETVNCGGQLERGTAYNVVLGVSYRFVVFSGQGLIKWRGEPGEEEGILRPTSCTFARRTED